MLTTTHNGDVPPHGQSQGVQGVLVDSEMYLLRMTDIILMLRLVVVDKIAKF
jgi:hypothetical protein